MKKRIIYWFVGAVLIVCVGAAAVSENPDFRLGRSMEIVVNILREINMFYVDETDPEKLLAGAAMGITYELDPYTTWMSADEMEDFQVAATGRYGGIGSLIRTGGDYVMIAQPYAGSPADRAGLAIGDRLLSIDGVSVVGAGSEAASAMLRGDPGTTFTLTVRKLASGEEETMQITRERIVIPGVAYHAMLNDSIGYIKHTDFSDRCGDDMRRALLELSADGRLKGLVLDYRGNGGGILQEAVKILSMFVPRGTEVVSMRGRAQETNFVFRTENEPIAADLPIVVLTGLDYRPGGSVAIPEISASAAEIVAGALQDLDRAVIVGQRTFGKGLVQSTRPTGYNTWLKLTTARYYIPSGRCIQAVDYARRTEDGGIVSIPDSLVRAFATAGGRTVYDGGGIVPDIPIDPMEFSLFTMIVQGRGYIDDFGDEHTRRNPSAGAPLAVDDALYGEFMRFMADKDVEYESRTKLALAELRRNAERELFYDDIREDLERIERSLRDDKENSLRLYRAQLSRLILDNLIMRRNYASGVTKHHLPHDTAVRAALDVLQDGERYRAILSGD
ncbi:MAG: S41 family peptidase [Rikenellaceae bacterium]|nr:S41 family peptidase [Rikenellaceae bacterium]MCL2692936.1 S41 family peptidase [Rikenellaceae bacterium]